MPKIKFKLIYIPIILMVLLCIFMVGITDYITAGFSLKNLTKPDFWINLIMINIGNISIITAIILVNVDKYKTYNELYNSLLNNIITFRKEKYVAPLFNKYCDEKNQKTKILYYKHNIQKKFNKIKPTPQDIIIYKTGTEEEKKNNVYCKNVEYYQTLLSDEFIKNNIDKLDIKYPKLTANLIFVGYKDNTTLTDYVTKHKVKKVIIDYLPKFLISFSVTIIISSIIPDIKDGINLATIIKTISKLFTMVLQVYFAIDYTKRYNNDVTLHDIQFRDSVINEYIIWENKQISILKNNERKEIIDNG